MYGFLSKGADGLRVHNLIFEIRITNYFVSKRARKWRENNIAILPTGDIVKNNVFDMELCLTKFKKHYARIYTEKDRKFLERDGKLMFLIYLLPLINGKGFYHFESQTNDERKMDLVINFFKQQFILELKLWYGEKRHQEAYEQLVSYLKAKEMDEGYLLTFDFRQNPDETYAENKWVEHDGKRIFDVVLRFGEEEPTKRVRKTK